MNRNYIHALARIGVSSPLNVTTEIISLPQIQRTWAVKNRILHKSDFSFTAPY